MAKKWLQGRLDEYDEAAVAADALNTQAAAEGENAAAKV